MKVKYSYTSVYNFRPGELCVMGKESLIHSGQGDLEDVLNSLEHNSSLKHADAIEWSSTDEWVERSDWKPWIGQPLFYITNIKIEKV